MKKSSSSKLRDTWIQILYCFSLPYHHLLASLSMFISPSWVLIVVFDNIGIWEVWIAMKAVVVCVYFWKGCEEVQNELNLTLHFYRKWWSTSTAKFLWTAQTKKGTACKLMELHARSCNCKQAHGTSCKLMELHASSCNYMQAHVTTCKLM